MASRDKSLLDYSWEHVSNWDYDANKHNCKIYDKDGKVLDQLDLDEIVKRYVHNLTDSNSVETSTDYQLEEKDKSLKMKKSSI